MLLRWGWAVGRRARLLWLRGLMCTELDRIIKQHSCSCLPSEGRAEPGSAGAEPACLGLQSCSQSCAVLAAISISIHGVVLSSQECWGFLGLFCCFFFFFLRRFHSAGPHCSQIHFLMKQCPMSQHHHRPLERETAFTFGVSDRWERCWEQGLNSWERGLSVRDFRAPIQLFHHSPPSAHNPYNWDAGRTIYGLHMGKDNPGE